MIYFSEVLCQIKTRSFCCRLQIEICGFQKTFRPACRSIFSFIYGNSTRHDRRTRFIKENPVHMPACIDNIRFIKSGSSFTSLLLNFPDKFHNFGQRLLLLSSNLPHEWLVETCSYEVGLNQRLQVCSNLRKSYL